MVSIQNYFNLPDGSSFNSNIPKKMFYDSGSLNASDKKLFVDFIDRIVLKNQLNDQTMNIKSYKDDFRIYEEIAFITIELKDDKKYKTYRTNSAADNTISNSTIA